jgi:hypothetical protein
MKRVLFCLGLVAACGGEPPASDFCDRMAEQNEGCFDENSRAECEAVIEDGCAEDDVVVLESCPVQFACS